MKNEKNQWRSPFLMAALVIIGGGLSAVFAGSVPAKKITMEQAQQIAMSSYPGTIQSKELENEHHRWVYSFDITNEKSPNRIREIQVDAHSGKIVSRSWESAGHETVEKQQEIKK